MKKYFVKIIIPLSFLIILFTSCSANANNNYNLYSDSPWNGNWYGYVGEYFYRLTFSENGAGLYYTGDTGYKLLYKTENYVYTSKSFSVIFSKSSDGKALEKDMEVYGTMIPGRDNGFYFWNDVNKPFFRLD